MPQRQQRAIAAARVAIAHAALRVLVRGCACCTAPAAPGPAPDAGTWAAWLQHSATPRTCFRTTRTLSHLPRVRAPRRHHTAVPAASCGRIGGPGAVKEHVARHIDSARWEEPRSAYRALRHSSRDRRSCGPRCAAEQRFGANLFRAAPLAHRAGCGAPSRSSTRARVRRCYDRPRPLRAPWAT